MGGPVKGDVFVALDIEIVETFAEAAIGSYVDLIRGLDWATNKAWVTQ